MGYSKQRTLVLRTLDDTKEHLTADQIYGRLKPDHPKLSLATVYRNLSGLAEEGRIRKISIPGHADRYDSLTAAHNHLVCMHCGAIVDVPPVDLSEVEEEIENITGTSIASHSLVLYGTCAECLAQGVGTEMDEVAESE